MKRLAKIVYCSGLFWLVSCSRMRFEADTTPEPILSPISTWDANPNTRVVLATNCCDGPITEELVRFYIPEAQLWGDGRFLWSQQDDEGARQVFVKQLSTDEMTGLLRKIAGYGFFDWDQQYVGEPVVDAPSQCLSITLTGRNKTVCASQGGAPDTLNTLFVWLVQGADTSGTLYWPERAYLTGFQLEETGVPLPKSAVAWPETLAHIPVGEAITGFWLDEGEALQLLWEAANRDPYHMPVTEDGNSRYRLVLQVPGVSWMEP